MKSITLSLISFLCPPLFSDLSNNPFSSSIILSSSAILLFREDSIFIGSSPSTTSSFFSIGIDIMHLLIYFSSILINGVLRANMLCILLGLPLYVRNKVWVYISYHHYQDLLYQFFHIYEN